MLIGSLLFTTEYRSLALDFEWTAPWWDRGAGGEGGIGYNELVSGSQSWSRFLQDLPKIPPLSPPWRAHTPPLSACDEELGAEELAWLAEHAERHAALMKRWRFALPARLR